MPDRTPVVFLHGLWVHASSWSPWVDLFRLTGYEPVAPGWQGDSATAAETRKHPEGLRRKGIEEVSAGYRRIIQGLPSKPILIGHSFGGLLAQKLLGEGLGIAAIALSPGQIKGVKSVPLAQIRSGLPVLSNPRNRNRTVPITRKQFRYAFANAVSVAESDELFATYAIPGPGRPVFQLSTANLNRNSPAKVDMSRTDRGPLLIVGAGKDRSAPISVAREAHHLYANAPSINDYTSFPGRGHSYVFDTGWREVADRSLAWLHQQGL
jgi:non-heme chloroperoxidase